MRFINWLEQQHPDFLDESKITYDCSTKAIRRALKTPCYAEDGRGDHSRVINAATGEYVTPIPRHRNVENRHNCVQIWKRLIKSGCV